MVFLGGIVGGLIIAMYLPIFEMAGNIKYRRLTPSAAPSRGAVRRSTRASDARADLRDVVPRRPGDAAAGVGAGRRGRRDGRRDDLAGRRHAVRAHRRHLRAHHRLRAPAAARRRHRRGWRPCRSARDLVSDDDAGAPDRRRRSRRSPSCTSSSSSARRSCSGAARWWRRAAAVLLYVGDGVGRLGAAAAHAHPLAGGQRGRLRGDGRAGGAAGDGAAARRRAHRVAGRQAARPGGAARGRHPRPDLGPGHRRARRAHPDLQRGRGRDHRARAPTAAIGRPLDEIMPGLAALQAVGRRRRAAARRGRPARRRRRAKSARSACRCRRWSTRAGATSGAS